MKRCYLHTISLLFCCDFKTISVMIRCQISIEIHAFMRFFFLLVWQYWRQKQQTHTWKKNVHAYTYIVQLSKKNNFEMPLHTAKCSLLLFHLIWAFATAEKQPKLDAFLDFVVLCVKTSDFLKISNRFVEIRNQEKVAVTALILNSILQGLTNFWYLYLTSFQRRSIKVLSISCTFHIQRHRAENLCFL